MAGLVALLLLVPTSAFADAAESALRWLAGFLGAETRRQAADLPWDQIVHGLLFCLLAWVWCRAPARAGRVRGVVVTAAAAVAYGGALELFQMLVGYRSGEWPDLFADATGVVLGALLASWRLPFRGRRARAAST